MNPFRLSAAAAFVLGIASAHADERAPFVFSPGRIVGEDRAFLKPRLHEDFVADVSLRQTRRSPGAETAKRDVYVAENRESALELLRYRIGGTEIVVDVCSGAHIEMTSNLDSVTESITRPGS